ncbi:major facilitator superfamily domain-containing protein [Amanita rubescens]|nr:major facilitator superfamily domain-containing protein [Amanita rubescens]
MIDHPTFPDTDTKGTSRDSFSKVESSEDDKTLEERIIRFVDWRILPLLATIYSFALIDRVNLGAANTAGMGRDLQLDIHSRYTIVTCVYFIPYVLLQLPGNLILRRFGVRNVIGFSVVGWGAVQLGMGFVPKWGDLAVCRVLLGACEASYFPAMIFVISTWYKRHEVQKRLAIFWLLAVAAMGFSPILAYVFSLLDGKRGIAGWSWIFIIEGAVTLFLGILAWLFIPDFPDKNTFLTPQETAIVLKRIEEDRGDSIPDPLTRQKVFTHLCDWTLWASGIMFMCASMPAYALAYYISIILIGMGWPTSNALLLSAPPYGPAILTTMFFSWLSDKNKHRAGYILIQATICLVGVAITAFAKDNAARYFGTFVLNVGNIGTFPGIIAYASNNVATQSKRSVQSAMTVLFAGCGGILASTSFRDQDAPRYIPGLITTMGCQGILIIVLAATHFHYRRLNRLSREGKLAGPLEGKEGFYYTL